ncbi:hypothetical protein PENFLA_c051G11056 [Penicillium flavigenum]|uniref:Uncharacterized protein n=1 Tax=Penicillium flavigenum TaxID=254877 RepID=A0A1V6SGY3_9EURO|nr:hypothetical protein PENFLA_c051G11056 [Penicillium flavigenum]
MESEAFVSAFLDACADGDLPNTQAPISSGRLTTEDLDEGLQLATERTHPHFAAALFDAGARATSAKDFLVGTQPQMPGIIRQFFDHGLDHNASASTGEPFLCILSNPASAREFLVGGADPNRCSPRPPSPLAIGGYPLARAIATVRGDDVSRIELLIAYGAKLESHLLFRAIAPRNMGHPLHRAIDLGLPNIIKALLDAGADPTARPVGTRYHDESPLQMAERSQRPKKQAMLDLLRP